MEKYEIEKLRDLPIEEVASQLGLQVARHKSLCPFHSDHHASLSFNTRKNLCRCFVCMDESLDSIGLVMKSLHVDFPKACFWLADRNGILLEKVRGRNWRRDCGSSSAAALAVVASSAAPSAVSSAASVSAPAAASSVSAPADSALAAASASSPAAPHSFDAARYARFFEHPWLNEAACRFLFDERKIDGRVARWCRLSSWTDRKGVNWLQIPYFDREGRLVGIQNRNLDFIENLVPQILKRRGKVLVPQISQMTQILRMAQILRMRQILRRHHDSDFPTAANAESTICRC